MAKWHFKRGSKVFGPLSEAELRQLLGKTTLVTGDVVRRGDADWRDASVVQQLFRDLYEFGWYVQRNGKELGPYTPRKIIDMRGEGLITKGTKVRQACKSTWSEFGAVHEGILNLLQVADAQVRANEAARINEKQKSPEQQTQSTRKIAHQAGSVPEVSHQPLKSVSMSDWFLREGDNISGPFTQAEMSRRLIAFEYELFAHVRQGNGQWRSADAEREFFGNQQKEYAAESIPIQVNLKQQPLASTANQKQFPKQDKTPPPVPVMSKQLPPIIVKEATVPSFSARMLRVAGWGVLLLSGAIAISLPYLLALPPTREVSRQPDANPNQNSTDSSRVIVDVRAEMFSAGWTENLDSDKFSLASRSFMDFVLFGDKYTADTWWKSNEGEKHDIEESCSKHRERMRSSTLLLSNFRLTRDWCFTDTTEFALIGCPVLFSISDDVLKSESIRSVHASKTRLSNEIFKNKINRIAAKPGASIPTEFFTFDASNTPSKVVLEDAASALPETSNMYVAEYLIPRLIIEGSEHLDLATDSMDSLSHFEANVLISDLSVSNRTVTEYYRLDVLTNCNEDYWAMTQVAEEQKSGSSQMPVIRRVAPSPDIAHIPSLTAKLLSISLVPRD